MHSVKLLVENAPPAIRSPREATRPAIEAVPDGLRVPPDLTDVLPRHKRIAVLGPGAGETCVGLARSGWFGITALEEDASAIEKARRAAERLEARPLPRFIAGDVACLPFAEDSFEAAIMQGLLTTLAAPGDRVRATREARRVLVPRGKLYLAEVAQMWHDPWYRRCYLMGRRMTGEVGTFPVGLPQNGEDLRCVHHYSERELVELLVRADFEIERFRYEAFALRSGGRATGIALVAVNRK